MFLVHVHLFPLVVFWGSLLVIGSLPHYVLVHAQVISFFLILFQLSHAY